MKPGLKYLLWGVSISVLAVFAAVPKIRPLLRPPAVAASGEHGSAGSGKQTRGARASDKALTVAVFIVKPSVFSEAISATGTLRADEAVELQAESSGRVVAINFVEGSRVRRGDLLLKLNDAPLRATLSRATQKRELAQAQERRLSTLVAQKLVTQYEYEAVRSELRVQEAEMELAQAQIAETEIRAPFDGVVGLRFVSLGAFVNANTRIATLQQLDRLKLDFTVPEKYAGKIRPGNPVTFRTADGQRYQGEIYAVDPRIDSATRTVLGRAVCRNDRGSLLPGAFASVEIRLSESKDALLIPAQSIIPGLDDRSVFVLRDGKAERRSIQTGARTDTTVNVLAGLVPGEAVIITGLVQLRAGQAVTPAPEAPLTP